jgi:hypothetical protein
MVRTAPSTAAIIRFLPFSWRTVRTLEAQRCADVRLLAYEKLNQALGRFSVFEARNPCMVASLSHM